MHLQSREASVDSAADMIKTVTDEIAQVLRNHLGEKVKPPATDPDQDSQIDYLIEIIDSIRNEATQEFEKTTQTHHQLNKQLAKETQELQRSTRDHEVYVTITALRSSINYLATRTKFVKEFIVKLDKQISFMNQISRAAARLGDSGRVSERLPDHIARTLNNLEDLKRAAVSFLENALKDAAAFIARVEQGLRDAALIDRAFLSKVKKLAKQDQTYFDQIKAHLTALNTRLQCRDVPQDEWAAFMKTELPALQAHLESRAKFISTFQTGINHEACWKFNLVREKLRKQVTRSETKILPMSAAVEDIIQFSHGLFSSAQTFCNTKRQEFGHQHQSNSKQVNPKQRCNNTAHDILNDLTTLPNLLRDTGLLTDRRAQEWATQMQASLNALK